MIYLRKRSSEEKSLIQRALDLCQADDFKRVVLRLDRPMFGDFTSDPCENEDEKVLERWELLLNEQCERLTELPMPRDLHGWIKRIALELLSYCRRLEELFGISRQFMMNFITRGDWTQWGRLDEDKLATRLVNDFRLKILQRYCIACVYCLSRDSVIATLWNRLTPEERQSLNGEDAPDLPHKKNRLVSLWPSYMDAKRHGMINEEKELWRSAMKQAVRDGNKAALISCLQSGSEDLPSYMVMNSACDAFYSWLSTQHDRDLCSHLYKDWRVKLVSDKPCSNVAELNLPFHYSDLVCFFLSRMNGMEQLTFFKKAFMDKQANYILECLLEWPHQDLFLPTVRKLWGILPKHNYARCLSILVSKYSGCYDEDIPRTVLYTEDDRFCDYQSLLFRLWEETPKAYRRYIFTDRRPVDQQRKSLHGREKRLSSSRFSSLVAPTDYWNTVRNESRVLFPRLLKRYPFNKVDEVFAKRVFIEAAFDEKRALLLATEVVWSTLIRSGNCELLDWLFEQSMAQEEAFELKRQFIRSGRGRELCFELLKGKSEKLLEGIMDWSFESTAERTEFRKKLIFGVGCFDACTLLTLEENFPEVERMVNFCLDSYEMVQEFKTSLTGVSTYCSMLENLEWEKSNRILAWCFDSEGEASKFKRDLLVLDRIVDLHYNLILRDERSNLNSFYEWFNLSDEEIRNLKKWIVFSFDFARDMTGLLFEKEEDISRYQSYLRWSLADDQILVHFKERLEDFLRNGSPGELHVRAKERLDRLTEELLSGLPKQDPRNITGDSEVLEEQRVAVCDRCKSEDHDTCHKFSQDIHLASFLSYHISSPPETRMLPNCTIFTRP